MKKVINLFEEIGIDNVSAKIYLYLVDHIQASAYTIANDTHIPRSTVYGKLTSLKKRGFISSFKKNRKEYFTPESFSTIQEHVKRQQSAIDDLVPHLRSLSKNAQIEKPSVRLFLGKDGARHAWEENLEIYQQYKTGTVYAITHPDHTKQFPQFFPKWVEKRKKLPLDVCIMYSESHRGNIGWSKTTSREQVRYIPDHLFGTGSLESYARGNLAVMRSFDLKKQQTIIIESDIMASIIESVLKAMWQIAKE